MRLSDRKLALRHGKIDLDTLSIDTLAAWLNSGWKKTKRIANENRSVPWARTCAIAGENSLFDRPVGSWKEAEKFVGRSRATVSRYLNKSIKHIRISDLERVRINLGCPVEYRQVCNLDEMEEVVETNRLRGGVSFVYVAAEPGNNELLDKAIYASLRAGTELVGLESEVELGPCIMPPGVLEKPEQYLGARRQISSNRIDELQCRMITRKWAKCVYWVPDIEKKPYKEIMYSLKAVVFGGKSLTLAVKTCAKLGVNFYLFSDDFMTVSRGIHRYIGCLEKPFHLGKSRPF